MKGLTAEVHCCILSIESYHVNIHLALNLQLFQDKWHIYLPNGMITKALLTLKSECDFWETTLRWSEQEQEKTAAHVILEL